MPQYWIISISEDNYMIAKDYGLIGMTDHGKKAIYEMVIGDMITFYISRKRVNSPLNDPAERVRKIRGIAKVTGEAFESNEMIWHGIRGNFPLIEDRWNSFPMIRRMPNRNSKDYPM